MKYLIAGIAILTSTTYCKAQAPKEPTPQAKAYFQEAMDKYPKYLGNADSMKIVFALLDKAVKADASYYYAWSEIVALRCQLDEYKPALVAIRKMTTLFPEDVFVHLLCGALETKTGNNKEALVHYNKVIKLVDAIPEKYRKGDNYHVAVSYKGVALLLMDKTHEGKAILQQLYNNEHGDIARSHLAYYLNSTTKEQVLDDVIPGKWN